MEPVGWRFLVQPRRVGLGIETPRSADHQPAVCEQLEVPASGERLDPVVSSAQAAQVPAVGGPGLDSRLRQDSALAEVSETFVSELALIRNCSEIEAEALAVESILLTTKLTGTWSALYDGRIDVRKMRAIVDLLGPAKPRIAAEIEEQVLPTAERLTVAQLRQRIRRALARLDAQALDKRRAGPTSVPSRPVTA